MPRRIFITVAEVSSDQHAAHLIHSLKSLDPDLVIEGLGGPAMRDAGAILHHETVHSAAMGFAGLQRVTETISLLKWTRNYYRKGPPDLHICCDSPAMNFHFAKLAHRFGVPVLYYVAPQLWAWREGRMKKLQNWVDRVACILPFEEQYFRGHNVNATFVGHPLFDELPPRQIRTFVPEFNSRAPVVGILPGSRKSEAEHNFPLMLKVAADIRQSFPTAKFLVPTTHATDPVVARLINNFPNMQFALGEFDRMVPQCDLCITVSGTATLHVAGYHVPMIVVYRLNPILWHLIGRWLIRTRTYALVNLLAGAQEHKEHIVPEFIPWLVSYKEVSALAIDYLTHPQKLSDQSQKLEQLVQTLDKPGASMNVAKMAMEMMR